MTELEALEWVGRLFDERPDAISSQTRREDVEAWDSLGVLTLMAGLDSDFSISLTDEEIEGVRTVGDILDVLRDRGALS